MCVWSDKCVDERAGFDFMSDGTMRPRKIGRWVLTHEECLEYMRQRNV